MHFLHPGALGWALLCIPIVLLFLVRRRPKHIRVSTLAFFKGLSHVYRESPWLRRLKKYLALALALATLLLTVGAHAHLVVAPEEGHLRSVLVLIDGSASMAAVDADGESRLAQAKARVRDRLAGLAAGVGVLLMRYDRRPEILLPHGYDRRAFARALEGLDVRPVEGDPQTALRLALRLAELHAPAAIWHVTDRPAEAQTSTADAFPEISLETIDVGLSAPRNVGLTGFRLRPRPLEHGSYDAFVQLDAIGPEPISARLEIHLDDRLVSLRDLKLRPGVAERLLFPLEARHGATLSLEVSASEDALRSDDRVVARVPQMRPIRLLWVREVDAVDPFTSLALSALAEEGVLEAYEATPDAYTSLAADFDVLLLDGWLPSTWPTDSPVLVMKPPRSLGPVHTVPIAGVGLPTESLRAIDETHPVLYGVASQRVALTQTAVLEADGSLAPLWVGEMGPMLVAGEVRGQKLVVMAFAADRSERLGMMASYPLLLGNAIFWLASDDAESRAGNNLATGSLLSTADAPLIWENGKGESESDTTVVVLDRQGLWQVGEKRGSASLLSRGETLLYSGRDVNASPQAHSTGGFLSGNLRPLLLWLAFALLLIEAWLFHRHALH